MASSPENVSMALFCDFENVALGVRDANYEKFDIKLVLERLLLKGSIVVKKAYCDWERYKGFKATMHEANFELIEIPHVRQSGKNSADIRLVRTPSTCATPRATSIPSSSSAAIPTSRRWSPSCAKTPSR
jgi:hypothetical protein